MAGSAPEIAALGAAGLVAGRLLNVAIDRIPRKEPLTPPWPRCPACREDYALIGHVPVAGYLLLRGRCSNCLERLPWRAPLVELLAGALFAYSIYHWGVTPKGLVALLYVSFFLAVAFIDVEWRIIPNVLVFPALLVALALSPWGPPREEARVWPAYLSAIEGGALDFAVLLVIYVVGRGAAIGEGDVKLGAVMGLMLGLRGSLVVLPLAFVIGGAVAIALLATRVKRRGEVIPFGPSLAAAGIASVFWARPILDWYRGLIGF